MAAQSNNQALRLENYRRMCLLNDDGDKITIHFNNRTYNHRNRLTLQDIEKYLQDNVDADVVKEIFAILDKADEKKILLEQLDERWKWSEYLTYLSEILNPDQNDPKIQIYRDLGILRFDGNVYLPDAEKKIKIEMRGVSVAKIEKLISVNLTKEMVDEIAYIVKRSLKGGVPGNVEPYCENGHWLRFFEDAMVYFTGFKSLVEARYNVYEKLGISSRIRFLGSTECPNLGYIYLASHCSNNHFIVNYQSFQEEGFRKLKFTSSTKLNSGELLKFAKRVTVNIFDKNASPYCAQIIDMILDKTIDDVMVTISTASCGVKVCNFTYTIAKKIFVFTHAANPIFTTVLFRKIQENLVKMKNKTDLAPVARAKLDIYESFGVISFGLGHDINDKNERVLEYNKIKLDECTHLPTTESIRFTYPLSIGFERASQKFYAEILKDLEATMPTEIKTLVEMVETKIISNVNSRLSSNGPTTLRMIISSTGRWFETKHTFKLDQFREIIEHIRDATPSSVPICSSKDTSFMFEFDPIDKPLPYPNIFFHPGFGLFEGIEEIDHLDTRISVPKQDGDIWKLTGCGVRVTCVVNSEIYGEYGWAIAGMEFQKVYDPSKFYIVATNDMKGPALTLYKYMLLHMAKYVNE